MQSAARIRADLAETESARRESITRRTIDLLGGAHVLRRPIRSDLDAHDVIREGISGKALAFVVRHGKVLDRSDVLKAVGVSFRTVQRFAETSKVMSPEQSGRIWRFAQVLAKAIDVFGTREQAEIWLASPAIALEQQRPVDLMESPVGIEMVEVLLGRLKYGVYT